MLAIICAMGIGIGIFALMTALLWSGEDDIYDDAFVLDYEY